MAFKTQTKHFPRQKKFKEGYWEERKQEELDKRKKVSFNQALKMKTENLTGATKRTHTVGQLVQYKNNKLAIVRHVTKKGVWLQEYEGKDVIDSSKAKIYFVKESDYEKNAEPAFWGMIMPSMLIAVPK